MAQDSVNATDGVDVAKGDMRVNDDHLEIYNGERWLIVRDTGKRGEHHYGKSCSNSTINYDTGVCSVCSAHWHIETAHPPYWEFDR
jgi:hypothetical protein